MIASQGASPDLSCARIVRAAASQYDEPCEHVRLIRKLRWVGLDQQAGRIELTLRGLPLEQGSVLADRYSADRVPK
jgi:hypothetical protein